MPQILALGISILCRVPPILALGILLHIPPAVSIPGPHPRAHNTPLRAPPRPATGAASLPRPRRRPPRRFPPPAPPALGAPPRHRRRPPPAPHVRSSLSWRRLDDRRRRPSPGLLRALRRRRVRPPLLFPSCYAKLSIQTLA